MTKPPAFQFYPDDFLGGTIDMTQSEVGAYMLLLCHQWNRGSIPVEPDRYQLIAKGPVTEHVLAKFPKSEDGKLRNLRLELERKKQADFREKQREKGLASAKARAAAVEPRLNHGSNSVDIRLQPEVNSPSPSPSSIKYVQGDVEEIAQAYPRQSHFRETREAIVRALEKHTPEEILAGTKAIASVIAKLPSGANNKYVPSPHTFFNNERWKDDPKTWLREDQEPQRKNGNIDLSKVDYSKGC